MVKKDFFRFYSERYKKYPPSAVCIFLNKFNEKLKNNLFHVDGLIIARFNLQTDGIYILS